MRVPSSETAPPNSVPSAPKEAPVVGGLRRPWMTFGADLAVRTLVEDVGVVLWEGGEKTTTEIKREIVELLDRVDSLVAVVDLKAAERPGEPGWWPSLATVQAWLDEDPFFAKAIDRWNHARQARILESVIYDLNGADPNTLTKAQFMVLKERVKFASSVLPRIVNRGLREKVDVETTSNHLHLHQNLSDDALEEKLRQLRRNPRVLEFLSIPALDGGSPMLAAGEVLEGVTLAPSSPGPGAPLPYRESLGAELGGLP